jgi:hypothetical protein
VIAPISDEDQEQDKIGFIDGDRQAVLILVRIVVFLPLCVFRHAAYVAESSGTWRSN